MLTAEAESGGPNGRLYAEQLLQTIAVQLVTRYTAEQPRLRRYRGGLPPVSLRRVREYVHAHLAGDLALEELAAVAGYSVFHFARMFRASTGQTPAAYVREVRMARAAQLLADAQLSFWTVAEVGAAVGYASPPAFAAAFRRVWGVSPSRYRRGKPHPPRALSS